MANNYLYIDCEICNETITIARAYRHGWIVDDEDLAEINQWFMKHNHDSEDRPFQNEHLNTRWDYNDK